MKKQNTKRVLSALLVVVMLLSAVPLGGIVGVDLLGTKASAVHYGVGDIIEFGSYPQSEVKDSATWSALNSKTLNWVSYGHYTGNGTTGSMVQSDYMKYADVMYNGNKYRAVRFTQYRPYWTWDSSSTGNTYQDDNGYYTNTTYWFKYEPLKWRVLDPSTGLVLSETCIDSQAYSNTIYYYNSYHYNDASHKNYASDYVTSSIREWLNDDFYNTAFNSTQQGKIVETTLDNSSPYNNNQYGSASTRDKIFLMSYNEMLNSAYGFSTSSSSYDVARRAKSTDYAKSQGCWKGTNSSYAGNAYWFLRSPGGDSHYACDVDSDGSVNGSCIVHNTILGVRPALCLHLTATDHTPSDWITDADSTCTAEGIKHKECTVCHETLETGTIAKKAHTAVTDQAVAPTCTTAGKTQGSHCSVCNTVITAQQSVAATGNHTDNNKDGKCDTCGKTLTQPNPSENCSCRCHKGGFQGFIYKIVRIFWKLFKTNQVCQCGVKHY